MIRIVIADDSAFMRKVLSDLFSKESDFQVVATARNGVEALAKVKELKPDLVTMDVNMPVMDGLTALESVMTECQVPVVMISSLTKAGTDATIKALSLGAVDFIEKVSGSISSVTGIRDEILSKCRAAVHANVRRSNYFHGSVRDAKVVPERKGLTKKPSLITLNDKLVVIGVSTGGPKALQEVIPLLPENFPCGVLVVQHMPPGFTKSLAERLNMISKVVVKEAEHNDIIGPGKVYIAPGANHMTVETQGNFRVIKLNQEPPVGNHRPSVNVLFESAAKYGRKIVAVELTGMGNDGARGMQSIKKAGGYVIAEDESTAVVYGMPKAVVELGLADKVLPLYEIANELIQIVKR